MDNLAVTPGRVILTKVLAAICGVTFVFAIAAAAAIATQQNLEMSGLEVRSGSADAHDLVFAIVCFAVGLAAMLSAIRIRHRMGRPIFEPWQRW